MQLRRIEIKAFKKLRHATIENIGDGLTVIVGDNEAGKSTVLSALRAVLFERHRVMGAPVDRMLPYGQNVRPEITIDFELQGVPWRLHKAFNQRPEARLSGPTTITGDAVEEKLAELFGFVPPGKGGSKREEHQGLYGLLWVDQGWAHHSLGVGGGKETLASALEGEVGQVIGGERGRALLAAAAERKDAFWGKNDRPKGPYKQLGDTLTAKQERREALVRDLSQYDDMLADLGKCHEALDRHERDRRMAKAINALAATREILVRAEGFERGLNDALQRFAVADKARELALEYRSRRLAMMAKVERTEADARHATRALDELRAVMARDQRAAEAAEQHRDAVGQMRIIAEARVRGAEEADVRRGRDDILKRVEAQLSQAEALTLGLREALGIVATHRIGTKEVGELDRLQRASEHAEAELRAASVEIAFEPEGPRAIAVDGLPQPGDSVLCVATDATIDLEGFGRIILRPGGGTEALAAVARDARRRLDDALGRWDCADVAAARSLLARKTEAEHTAASHTKMLLSVAPDGIEALRQTTDIERRGLTAPLSPEAADFLAAPSSIDELRRRRDQAADSERAAEAEAKSALAGRDRAGRDVAVAVERAANARALHADAVAEIESSRARTSDDLLRDNLLDLERSAMVAVAALDRAKSDLANSDAATARLDFERAEHAERIIRADIDRLRTQRRELEIELNVRGRAGLGEDLGDLDGQIERLTKTKEAQDLEATASRLLLQTLTEAQQESKDRWLEPVREKIRPYLRFIDPDSDIVLNDQTLEIEGLVRNGQREPFASLSVGAREQVAVITRLALADILRASGVPSALILDDALVNTDEGRLERMHRVLQTAAKSLQVLVLTCREKDFIGLGDLKRL